MTKNIVLCSWKYENLVLQVNFGIENFTIETFELANTFRGVSCDKRFILEICGSLGYVSDFSNQKSNNWD